VAAMVKAKRGVVDMGALCRFTSGESSLVLRSP
jgi:hypothetical protein